jgi:hypothetical protein
VKNTQQPRPGPDAWCEVSVLKVKAVPTPCVAAQAPSTGSSTPFMQGCGVVARSGLRLTGPGQGCGQARHVAAPTRSMQAGARARVVARLG